MGKKLSEMDLMYGVYCRQLVVIVTILFNSISEHLNSCVNCRKDEGQRKAVF